jgi:hypothetical protein
VAGACLLLAPPIPRTVPFLCCFQCFSLASSGRFAETGAFTGVPQKPEPVFCAVLLPSLLRRAVPPTAFSHGRAELPSQPLGCKQRIPANHSLQSRTCMRRQRRLAVVSRMNLLLFFCSFPHTEECGAGNSTERCFNGFVGALPQTLTIPRWGTHSGCLVAEAVRLEEEYPNSRSCTSGTLTGWDVLLQQITHGR